jgi:hypothetical protein
MSLTKIIWNKLYRCQPFERAFAAMRIKDHFAKMPSLRMRGAQVAYVWYVLACFFLFSFFSLSFPSN